MHRLVSEKYVKFTTGDPLLRDKFSSGEKGIIGTWPFHTVVSAMVQAWDSLETDQV